MPDPSPANRVFALPIVVGAVAVLGLIVLCPTAPAQAAAEKPNVVIILADDMGFSDAGCYGGEIQTPNLDRLAAGGLRFTRFYNTARCWPTRSAIMTGYYPQQIRMDPPRGRLPAWASLLPHHLRPLGYRCYHVGKWHVTGAPKPVADGGFDRSYWFEDWDRYFSPAEHFEDDVQLPPVSPDSGYYATTAFADHAIGYLKDHATTARGTAVLLVPGVHLAAFSAACAAGGHRPVSRPVLGGLGRDPAAAVAAAARAGDRQLRPGSAGHQVVSRGTSSRRCWRRSAPARSRTRSRGTN